MGTRSRIGIMHGDVCKSVYVHWDGYLAGVGATLLEHYSSSVKVNQLIAGGDFSSLEDNIADIKFYKDQYDERDTSHCSTHSFDEFYDLVDETSGEYYYIMQDGVWYVGTTYNRDPLYKKLTVLTPNLVKQGQEQNA